jgi:hypothetical protein
MYVEPVEIFYSYSHKDEKLRDQLAVHLTMLQRQGVIKAWHDRSIGAGSEWAKEIDDKINSARIILLLVSANFLASDYCYSIEMSRALERHEAGEALVIPIILKPVDWSGAPFGKLQAFPKNAKPVTTWSDRDKAFVDIAQGIRKAVEEIVAKRTELKFEPQSQALASSYPLKHSAPSLETASATVHSVNLENPEGSVSLDSPLYVERPPVEQDCYETIIRPGALIRLKAPRQMGKTSLLQRILSHAQQHGQLMAYLNFQSCDSEFLTNIDSFLQWFCASVANELNLDDRLDEFWKGVLGSKNKCTNYFQRYLLSTIPESLTLGLDEVDQVFQYPETAQDFFGLLRTWHERGKNEAVWRKLRLVIAHSKEVYIPLNINQSPFNVGLPIELPEFNQTQVIDLIQRHGLNWSMDQVQELMGVVDGHPYLLRKALYDISRGKLTLKKFIQVAPTEEGLYGDHLRRHLINITSDPDLQRAMRQVVMSEQPVRLDPTQAFKLRSMGLVELRGNNVASLCNLYNIYFRDRLGIH